MPDQEFNDCKGCDQHICNPCSARDRLEEMVGKLPVMRLLEAMRDAVSILDSGSDYERMHVSTILSGGLDAFQAQISQYEHDWRVFVEFSDGSWANSLSENFGGFIRDRLAEGHKVVKCEVRGPDDWVKGDHADPNDGTEGTQAKA